MRKYLILILVVLSLLIFSGISTTILSAQDDSSSKSMSSDKPDVYTPELDKSFSSGGAY